MSGTAVKAKVGQGPSTQHNRGFKSYERNEKDHHSVEILENGRCPNLESFAAVLYNKSQCAALVYCFIVYFVQGTAANDPN